MNKRGVSLIEVIVSVTIFVILMITSLQIFKVVLDGQRQAVATSNLQESLKYFFEVISKEIRMAQPKEAGDTCNIETGKLFNLINNELYLKNYHGECVVYELVNDRFQVTRGDKAAFLSPSQISIESLNFNISQESSSQAYVTISLKAQALLEENVEIILQTSIASRNYK